MIRNALLVVRLTCCATIASAQRFPLWERFAKALQRQDGRHAGAVDEARPRVRYCSALCP
jgi:hypothetical protein